MTEDLRFSDPASYHSQLVARGKRANGRTLDEFRNVKIETNAIKTADASSLVKLGNTSVVCGCTLQQMHEGVAGGQTNEVQIKLEMPPICFIPNSNKSQHTAQLLTKTINNILDDMNFVDKQKLHSKADNSYWSLMVEVVCLNEDGGLLDTAIIAIISALRSLELTCKSQPSSSNHKTQKISFNTVPITSTFALINGRVLCDPSSDEESFAQTTLSVSVDSNQDSNLLVKKIGGKSISNEVLSKCIKLAKLRARLMRPVVMGADGEQSMDVG